MAQLLEAPAAERGGLTGGSPPSECGLLLLTNVLTCSLTRATVPWCVGARGPVCAGLPVASKLRVTAAAVCPGLPQAQGRHPSYAGAHVAPPGRRRSVAEAAAPRALRRRRPRHSCAGGVRDGGACSPKPRIDYRSPSPSHALR
jgi:hypothetical protein